MSKRLHRRRHESGRPIYVVVVESHQHVLEHIHSILRKRRTLESWSMLHFDAHPDLACPNVPARLCFQPRHHNDVDLYECLDATSSGIAEWILPLVLAGGLTTVHWVKPAESKQLANGHHEYHVGAWIPPSAEYPLVSSFLDLPSSARVCVDWKHPYYLDDASVVSTDELLLAKKLHLTVSELLGEENEKCTEGLQRKTEQVEAGYFHGDWALDICLDYFACLNPFLTDIEAIDTIFAENLRTLVTRTRMHTAADDDTTLEPACYKSEVARFHAALQRLFQERGGDDSIDQLVRFYRSEEEGRIIAENLVQSLNLSPEPSSLITMAIEAVSNLSMPHDPKSSLKALQKSVTRRLGSVSHKLGQMKTNSGDPFVVMIARSSNDGFTPSSIVEELQKQILTIVHTTFCGCDFIPKHGYNDILLATVDEFLPQTVDHNCRLRVIFDYGKAEGAFFE